MSESQAALLRLRLAESRLKRAHDLALVVSHDRSKRSLFIATSRDLPKVRENFDVDYVRVELAATESTNEAEKIALAARLEEFEERYFFVMATVDSLTEKKENIESSAALKSHSSHVVLPKINIPVFNGDPKQWTNFASLFATLVINNDDLSQIERLAYLKGALQGEPQGMIQSLHMSDANFEVAWKLLSDRYENKRLLVSMHVDALLQAPSASADSPTSLRHLLCTINENVSALHTLEVPVDQWDLILLPIVCKRLDTALQTQWEMTLSTDLPSLKDFITFLEKHCRALEAVASNTSNRSSSSLAKSKGLPTSSNWRQPHNQTASKCLTSSLPVGCCLCPGTHQLYNCPEFSKQSPMERFSVVKRHQLCGNCLYPSHRSDNCRSSSSCRRCGARHHTLLHFDRRGSDKRSGALSKTTSNQCAESQSSTVVSAVTPDVCLLAPTVLLSTALVHILDASGAPHVARALLDTASQVSFVTEHCIQKLGLTRLRTHLPVHGLSNTTVNVVKSCSSVVITPCDSPDLHIALDVFVLPRITNPLPRAKLSPEVRRSVAHLKLADPTFDTPGPIDLLIGADVFPQLITGRKIDGTPMALGSVLGWLLMGHVAPECKVVPSVGAFYCTSLLSVPPLEKVMRRFWEVEEFPPIKRKSAEEVKCETLFVETHSRDDTGRYVVSLPFRSQDHELGSSRPQAVNRLLRLEKRLSGDPPLRDMYNEFMKDYLVKGHMEKIPESQLSSSPAYYIPHHCVLKPHSSTTKLRVVFDASAKSSTGMSLNDMVLSGPRLQQDVIEMLVKVRLHEVVFTADIQQMYRQITICPDHQDFQRIVWRFDDSSPVEDFCLKTVTYGVSSSPYLAIRTLQQLAEDEKERFPAAAKVLQTDFYVDDVVTGASSVESALSLQKELRQLLAAGGFKLRKFVSNNRALLDWLPSDEVEVPEALSLDQDSHFVKILGLQWNPREDVFSYQIQTAVNKPTKRTILSDVARIFDPLGWLSPLSMFAKHLIQVLWLQNLDWDAEPPSDIMHKWAQFNKELPCLSNITIPRKVVGPALSVYHLHGFADSSETGYAAVVYLLVASGGEVTTHLVAGKSKVAPVKAQSLPRLELCGALLLARLLHHVIELFANSISLASTVAWTDSQVVLAWINSSPHLLKTFVANRVSEIQELTSPSSWRYVPSESNPADCASRGLLPAQLVNHPLWWTGPCWLQESVDHWPVDCRSSDIDARILESKVFTLATTVSVEDWDILIARFSSLMRLLRVVSFVVRFVHNCRSSPASRLTGKVNPVELDKALQILLLHVQSIVFKDEILSLKNGQRPSPQLRKLAPFIDDAGLIRVGGRLHHSELPFEQKHPILLPKTHPLTDLIIYHYHHINLHPGIRTLQGILREQYWILSDRHAITRLLRKCLRCWRAKPSPCRPLMGDLPAMRVQQVKPFARTGVDYAGPFLIKSSRTRKSPVLKSYLCIFVCCATKAVHVELASDLSTDVFLAAYRRFVSRRGRSVDIYSDCGTNFVGARNRMIELQQLLHSSDHQDTVVSSLAPLGIRWHFNPPAAPHFGGLWEASVKSFKSHLTRVIGEQILTFEELYTVVVQVEAVLNSRPLCPLSSDPSDISALTPGHFLTLEPLVAVPEQDLLEVSLNRLQRWQLVERLHQDFWRCWHRDYLHTLQQRAKWQESGCRLAHHQLVLIKDERVPPLQWRLGRVVELHKGSDGIARVATVHTAQGTVKRPAVKLCPLPIDC